MFHRAFGRVVRETRARSGFSQEELGFRGGLHRNYVGAIERGEINPTLRVILKLARGFDVRPSELMTLAEEHFISIPGATWSPTRPTSYSAEWSIHAADVSSHR